MKNPVGRQFLDSNAARAWLRPDWRQRMSKMSGDTARFYRIRAARNRRRARVQELRKEIEARKQSGKSGVEAPPK
jgi:hypothetical protein